MRVINFDYEVNRKDNHVKEIPKALHISYFPFSTDYMLCLHSVHLSYGHKLFTTTFFFVKIYQVFPMPIFLLTAPKVQCYNIKIICDLIHGHQDTACM
jgi:hypothetical protein